MNEALLRTFHVNLRVFIFFTNYYHRLQLDQQTWISCHVFSYLWCPSSIHFRNTNAEFSFSFLRLVRRRRNVCKFMQINLCEKFRFLLVFSLAGVFAQEIIAKNCCPSDPQSCGIYNYSISKK